MKKIIATDNAPAAIGPYSQAVTNGTLVFVSGQLPIDPATGAFPEGGVAAQTKQSLSNVEAILKSGGSDLSRVLKTTVYLKNIADFGAMNEVYATFFTTDAPARAAFEVAALPKGALVEIEVVAEIA